MSCECKVMIVKYILTKYGQMRQKRFKIKNKFTILILYLKLFLTLSCHIKLFYQTCLNPLIDLN